MRVRTDKLSMSFQDGERTVEVFKDLSLDVQGGSSLAIIGESGVGKTTLLHLLGTLERPTSGRVWLGDSCVTDPEFNAPRLADFRGKSIGFVFQFHYLLPEFDALEHVAMPLLVRGVSRMEALRQARDLLGRVGLQARLTHRPTMLSGGEQQRVAIARALVTSPGLVLADEPTGNLDYKTGGAVQELMLEMQRELGTTLLVVTHSRDLAQAMGRVVELTANGLVERSS